jgi:diguanylate cyclase
VIAHNSVLLPKTQESGAQRHLLGHSEVYWCNAGVATLQCGRYYCLFLTSMFDLQPFSDFETAAQATLAFLHQRLGFDLWMVTRLEGNQWIVLQAEENGYGIQKSTVLSWADTLCQPMRQGQSLQGTAETLPLEVASTGLSQQLAISAYIGAPLRREDGGLFGMLCAVHPASQESVLAAELPLVELCAQLLSSILSLELHVAEVDRLKERAESDAMIDALTGLYNRRGWDKLTQAEEIRCRRYGHSACVLVLDLDGLKQVNDQQGHPQGDELIRRVARTIQRVLRESDVAARIGGDEFAILGIECDEVAATAMKRRLETAFAQADVHLSIGLAVRDPMRTLTETFATADQAMYAVKRSRRNSRNAQSC